jgi:hypothetical protein
MINRLRHALAATFIVTAVVVLSACGGGGGGTVEPGDWVGEMVVMTGASQSPGIFEFCSPIVLKPGVYSRECAVPAVPQLFIGYGTFEKSRAALDREWDTDAKSWQAFLDKRKIDLESFGTMPDRSFYETSFGAPVVLREWNVLLVEPTPGEHTLRYVVGAKDPVDITWTFTVRGR